MSSNEFGLDADYMRKNLKRILSSADHYKPDEMARALARLVVVADANVLQEPEFASRQSGGAVPVGYALVPKVPTTVQVNAGVDADDLRTGFETVKRIYRAMIDEAIAPPAAAEQVATREWLPIETAPKDGRTILLAKFGGRYGMADGHYEEGCWVWPFVKKEPTHWLPLDVLPTAPAPTGEPQ